MKTEKTIIPGKLKGTVNIPSSKSDSQRALLAATLSKKVSRIYHIGSSDDELNMLNVIRHLGAQVEANEEYLLIKGPEYFPENVTLNTGESGLGTRLVSCVLSAYPGKYIIKGKGSILKRDMIHLLDSLALMGVDLTSKSGKLPITLNGGLKSGTYKIDGSQGSQVLSGLLMALPLLEKDSVLKVKNLKSKPYVDMTIRTLKYFGVEITERRGNYHIPGHRKYKACKYFVEADWSSASCWLVASALGANIKVEGLNFKSLQADMAVLMALKAANCKVIRKKKVFSVDGSKRTAFSFDATDCPDLFPALVVLAVFIQGKSVLKGVKRLKNKESNRGIVLMEEFNKLGADIRVRGDKMIIRGKASLKGGNVESHGDHRIAMALAIAAKFSNEQVKISNAEAVSKSYPDFWNHLTILE